jgi:DNA-binding cell septation regulator SpoVG
MAFKDNAVKVQEKTAEATTGTTYTYTISNVKEVTDTMVSFRMVINGITIYGMKVIKYKSKKTGEEGMMVSFPSRKGSDGKYYNELTFPMTKDMSDDIIKKVLEAL